MKTLEEELDEMLYNARVAGRFRDEVFQDALMLLAAAIDTLRQPRYYKVRGITYLGKTAYFATAVDGEDSIEISLPAKSRSAARKIAASRLRDSFPGYLWVETT